MCNCGFFIGNSLNFGQMQQFEMGCFTGNSKGAGYGIVFGMVIDQNNFELINREILPQQGLQADSMLSASLRAGQ